MVAIPCAYTGSSVFIYPDYITKNTCLISCKIPTSDSLKPVYRSSKTNREPDEAVFFSITLQNKCFTTEYKKTKNKTVWIDANYTDLINCQTWWHCVVKSPKHFGRCFSLTEPANKPFQTGFVFSFLSINFFYPTCSTFFPQQQQMTTSGTGEPLWQEMNLPPPILTVHRCAPCLPSPLPHIGAFTVSLLGQSGASWRVIDWEVHKVVGRGRTGGSCLLLSESYGLSGVWDSPHK